MHYRKRARANEMIYFDKLMASEWIKARTLAELANIQFARMACELLLHRICP
jgi:hypothetical protein